MTNNIKQVLEMNKAGTITDDQAEQLINEIMRSQKEPAGSNPDPGPKDSRDYQRWSDWKHDAHRFARSTVRGVFDTVAEGMENFHATQSQSLDGNDFQLSHVEPPAGQDFIFRGNRMRMSKLSDLRLDSAEFSGNKVDASRMAEVKLHSARLIDCDVNTSSIVELSLDKSEIQLMEMVSCKAGEISLSDESVVRDSRFHASVLRECRMEGKSLVDKSRISCSVWGEITLHASTLASSEFDEMKMKEVSLERSTWNRLIVRDAAMADLRVSDSHFDNVLVSSKECWGWKKRGWTKLKVEHSTLKNVGFVDCRIHDTVIRDVDLSDLKIQGLILEHQTLVGNDAFLRAVAPFRK